MFVELDGAESGGAISIVRELVALYKAWGKPDDEAEWRAKLPSE